MDVSKIKKNGINSDKKNSDRDCIKFTKKEAMYYVTIHKFFKTCKMKDIEKMIDIINGESDISLRVLDWVVTRYAKKIMDFKNNDDEFFDMHISYKSQLRAYKKIYFDPFRRYCKFYYRYDPNNKKKKILTTIGQLNFFKWAFSNGIMQYVEINLDTITKAMNVSNKEDKHKKNKKNTSQNSDDTYNSLDSSLDSESDADMCSDEKSSKSSKTITVKKKQNNINDDIFDNDTTGKLILYFD